MKRLPFFVDGLLSAVGSFIIGAVVGGYFLRSALDVFLFAAIFSVCVSRLYLFRLGASASAVPKAVMTAAREEFVYSGEDFALRYFAERLSSHHKVLRRRGYLIVDGRALFCRIKPLPLTADEAVEIGVRLRRSGCEKAVVLTDECSDGARAVLMQVEGKTVRVLEFSEVLRLLVSLGYTPSGKPKHKTDYGRLVRNALGARRAGGYLLGGTMFLLLARVLRYSIFYIACAALLYCFAAVAVLVPLLAKKPKR